MTTIEHLQALKRRLETLRDCKYSMPCEYTKGVTAGYSWALQLVEDQIKMIEAGEKEGV